MDKVICLDGGYYIHRAIFSTVHNKMPVGYTMLNMMVADLKKIEISEEDYLIWCCDSYRKKNWRYKLDVQYKANRKKRKDEGTIDWKKCYEDSNRLINNLKYSTPLNIVECHGEDFGTEADDIMAVAVKQWPNREVILITPDADLEQLCAYDNCKIFSPKMKRYKIVNNPHLIIAKKIDKEASDNLVKPILSQRDFEIREQLVNLLKLPDFVESVICKELQKVGLKHFDTDLLPFKSFRSKFKDIYNNSNTVSFDDAVQFESKRKEKAKKKKQLKKCKATQLEMVNENIENLGTEEDVPNRRRNRGKSTLVSL